MTLSLRPARAERDVLSIGGVMHRLKPWKERALTVALSAVLALSTRPMQGIADEIVPGGEVTPRPQQKLLQPPIPARVRARHPPMPRLASRQMALRRRTRDSLPRRMLMVRRRALARPPHPMGRQLHRPQRPLLRQPQRKRLPRVTLRRRASSTSTAPPVVTTTTAQLPRQHLPRLPRRFRSLA